MAYTRTIARRNATINAEITAYGTAAALVIYADSASAPTVDAALPGTATILATITLGNPSHGAASAGSSALTGTPSSIATATGTALYFRILVTGTVVAQGSCAVSASDLNFAGGTTITSGGTVTLSSGTLSQAA